MQPAGSTRKAGIVERRIEVSAVLKERIAGVQRNDGIDGESIRGMGKKSIQDGTLNPPHLGHLEDEGPEKEGVLGTESSEEGSGEKKRRRRNWPTTSVL